MRKIIISPQARKILTRKYSLAMVSYALTYQRNSKLAQKIRDEAITVYKGKEVVC